MATDLRKTQLLKNVKLLYEAYVTQVNYAIDTIDPRHTDSRALLVTLQTNIKRVQLLIRSDTSLVDKVALRGAQANLQAEIEKQPSSMDVMTRLCTPYNMKEEFLGLLDKIPKNGDAISVVAQRLMTSIHNKADETIPLDILFLTSILNEEPDDVTVTMTDLLKYIINHFIPKTDPDQKYFTHEHHELFLRLIKYNQILRNPPPPSPDQRPSPPQAGRRRPRSPPPSVHQPGRFPPRLFTFYHPPAPAPPHRPGRFPPRQFTFFRAT